MVAGLPSLQPTVTACPRPGPPGSQEGKEASFGLSHVKEALGQEAGRQGYSLETGRTWGPGSGTEGLFGISALRGTGKPLSACALSLVGSLSRGSSSGPALGIGSRPTWASQCILPPCSEKAEAAVV